MLHRRLVAPFIHVLYSIGESALTLVPVTLQQLPAVCALKDPYDPKPPSIPSNQRLA